MREDPLDLVEELEGATKGGAARVCPVTLAEEKHFSIRRGVVDPWTRVHGIGVRARDLVCPCRQARPLQKTGPLIQGVDQGVCIPQPHGDEKPERSPFDDDRNAHVGLQEADVALPALELLPDVLQLVGHRLPGQGQLVLEPVPHPRAADALRGPETEEGNDDDPDGAVVLRLVDQPVHEPCEGSGGEHQHEVLLGEELVDISPALPGADGGRLDRGGRRRLDRAHVEPLVFLSGLAT